MPAEEQAQAERGPACSVAAAVEALINVLQRRLAQLGTAFAGDVHLMPDGTFAVRCPINREHAFWLGIGDDGTPLITCPTCSPRPELHARFIAVLHERLPQWGLETASGVHPVTGWEEQPEGAPAIALRRLKDGRVEVINRRGREAEVAEWLRQ